MERPSPLGKQYRLRIVDGSCLAGTERWLEALRQSAAKPLSGKTIAILDPGTKLVVDVISCEDGHAQERSLFNQVLAQVQPQQVWIKDRVPHACDKHEVHMGEGIAISVPQDFSIAFLSKKRFLSFVNTGIQWKKEISETTIV